MVEFREAPIDNERVSSHKHRIADYLRPKTLAMLLLGFSSGLPFLLVGNTFGYWLRDEHTSLTAIGFLSWVGIAYSLKFLWAPVMDRVDLPLFKRLGHRRGWMMFSQILVGLALAAMCGTGTKAGLGRLGALALVVAFASSTQDIVVDAWRIESADDGEEQGLLASAYQFSYRLALLATDSVILIVAATVGWRLSYGIYGASMALGIIATWLAKEPQRADAVMNKKEREAPLWTPRGFFDAVVGPFIAFFRAHGWLALVMLAAISLYRLPDFIMGPMANPYYHDIGLSKQIVGEVRGSIGLIATFAGIAAGGFCSLKLGYMRALIIGGILQAAAIASYATLAFSGTSTRLFALVMAGDNFSISFAGVALVAYMSSLTNIGYTATQYALLSSTYAWLGKILKGFSGAEVENLSTTHGLIHGYGIFFIACGLTGLPAVLLFAVLGYWLSRKQPIAAAASQGLNS
ncbi:MAG TPA: MFS transporter [Terriglobales bacterium]|jgi:PAT family beta-lactamase induction signal transducer AmpG|nr:MFS transporter [Terriglobales bacterium]